MAAIIPLLVRRLFFLVRLAADMNIRGCLGNFFFFFFNAMNGNSSASRFDFILRISGDG